MSRPVYGRGGFLNPTKMSTLDKFRCTLRTYRDVCNSGRGEYAETTTFTDISEFKSAARLMNISASLSENTRIFGKETKSGERSIWMTVNTFKITIQYQPARPSETVRDSSREAYAALDTGTLQGRVAACILEASRNGGNITRAEVAHAMQMEKSTITARIKELLDMSVAGTIVLNGQHYRLMEMPERRVSKTPQASNVKSYALRLVMSAPANYQPAAPAAQTTMF